MPEQNETSNQTPLEYCIETAAGFKLKADHNKCESLWCFFGVILFTLTGPLFVTLGEGIFLGKVAPSVLSLSAAGLTAWIQLRKPQQLWTLYRSAQRELEDAATRYRYGIGEFEDTVEREKNLAKKVADVAIGVHHQWVALVPNPEKLQLAETVQATQKVSEPPRVSEA
jgi:hypothetical protein